MFVKGLQTLIVSSLVITFFEIVIMLQPFLSLSEDLMFADSAILRSHESNTSSSLVSLSIQRRGTAFPPRRMSHTGELHRPSSQKTGTLQNVLLPQGFPCLYNIWAIIFLAKPRGAIVIACRKYLSAFVSAIMS